MNDLQIKAKIRDGKPGRYRVDSCLYLRITPEKSAFWVLRYMVFSKRRELTLGRYGKKPAGLSLFDARHEASIQRAKIKNGSDPIAEKNRPSNHDFKTVDDVAQSWLEQCDSRHKHPEVPRRIYTKNIYPKLGGLAVANVSSRDIFFLVKLINESGRPTIANDVLSYCKQIFTHAIKLDLIKNNPASPFSVKDAGGVEQPRKRTLNLEEIENVFRCFRDNHQQFTRENYLACVMLICLGVRKSELIGLPWAELDLKNSVWNLPAERSKNKQPIAIPLQSYVVSIFEELKIRAFGSSFVFPNRRRSKRYEHMSPDTLNAAINKLFAEKKLTIPHFTVHDFRRTYRTLLSSLGTPPHIAEKCMNHGKKSVEATYDQYAYFDERQKAHNEIIDLLIPYL